MARDPRARSLTLEREMAGEVIGPGDAGYEEACAVFNGMIRRRPAVIVRPAHAEDAGAAVRFARERGLSIAVRSGGHSVSGLSICDDGLLLDLEAMRAVEVDPHGRTALAGGGARWGEFDRATQEHGLHTPGGRVTTTGLGGFTTGGGYGWTSSKHGLACDNLLAAEVVTADGQVVTASDSEHPDLFWAIRGGGGNFGIVTRFTFELHPLGPTVLAGLALWPLARGREVVRAWRDHVEDAPDELGSACAVVTAPPEDFVPEHLRGRPCVALVAIHVGDPDEGGPLVRPLKDLSPDLDLIGPMSYVDFQAMLDPASPPGLRNYWRGEYLSRFDDDAIDTFLEHASEPLSPFAQHVVFRLGGAIARVGRDATAVSHREAPYMFHPLLIWEDPADDERHIGAARRASEALRRFGEGAVYLNFTPEGEAGQGRRAWPADVYERLVAVKRRYDPDNVFRLNQNIPPGDPAA